MPELPPLYLEDVRLRLVEEADYAFLRALYRQ
ncbi:MAG: N-acetyltransferase, partial [Starkeya sp.]|nr:N-acetyltransferase [Starkeya sp.]